MSGKSDAECTLPQMLGKEILVPVRQRHLGVFRFRVMAENADAKCAAHQHGAVPEPRGPQLLTSPMAP